MPRCRPGCPAASAHRVALGRLLLARCDALLLDEPFASLDAVLRRSLTALVKDLAVQRAVPTLLVTHQLADAQAFADRLAVMDRGLVLQVGAPDEVVLPARLPPRRRARGLPGLRARRARAAADGAVAGPGPRSRACTRTASPRARTRPAGSS